MESSSRYSRQVLFPRVGAEGQARLARARVVLVGCGALGASSAELLARSGTGHLRVVDRDVVEASNLGRQALYDAQDAEQGRPKAAALAAHLARFNPEITIEPVVADVTARNARDVLEGADLVVDGCDNFDTRYLLNDWSVSTRVPWIYGACVGARGLSATIIPGRTPCLRCLFPEPPPSGAAETCDTAGIIGPAATLIASLQVTEALKLLVGDTEALRRGLLSVELWPFRTAELGASAGPSADCPACGKGELDWLDGRRRPRTQAYCGRDSVQVLPADQRGAVDLDALQERLARSFSCRRHPSVLRVEVPGHPLTIFDDGRCLVSGTGDEDLARSLYDRYVGS